MSRKARNEFWPSGHSVTEPAVHRRTVELPGRIIPDPNASGYVQASVGGRLSAPNGGFPRLGTPVKKGDVLAYVTPPMQAIDVSDMRQRQGELDQQMSIVERRLARYEQLAPSGAVAKSLLEETRLELQGLKERRASLDKVRRESEELVAPVDGVIADGTPVAGQITQPNAVVFHIVDPTRLWVEALSYEALAGVQSATARIGGKALNLSYRGSGFCRSQSVDPDPFCDRGPYIRTARRAVRDGARDDRRGAEGNCSSSERPCPQREWPRCGVRTRRGRAF